MAKDLPYFKFNVSEYINGNITLEDFYTQGVFVNICAYYWFKSGKVTLTEMKRRLSKAKPIAFEKLVASEIIKVDGDKINISFLDEQLIERGHLSATNSENGKLGGRPKKSEEKAVGFSDESESKAKKSNIEEKREEEKREEEKANADAPFEGELMVRWKEWERHRKEKRASLTPTVREKQIKLLGGRPPNEAIAILDYSLENGYTGLFPKTALQNGNGHHTKTSTRPVVTDDGKGKTFGAWE